MKITPEFYAENEIAKEYVVEGNGFSRLTETLIGTASYPYQEPIENKDTQNDSLIYNVQIIDDQHLRLRKRTDVVFTSRTYLGGIFVESTREAVWVNQNPF